MFLKNIDVNVFDDVLKNAKHRANDASNDANRPPLPPAGVSPVSRHQGARQLPKIPRQLAQQSGADDEGDDDDDDGDDNDFIRNTIEKGLNIKSFIVINDDYIFIQSESFLLARLAG